MTYEEILSFLDGMPDTAEKRIAYAHGVARTIGWGDINHVEAEIKRGEEMIMFLKELLLHGILWY